MTYLLLPGRQIVNTRYQEAYLDSILDQELSALPEMMGTPPSGKITDIVFAVTSCNKSNSRYNPLPFEIRSILVYEFVRQLKAKHGTAFHIVGIPHYQPNPKFASTILKEIEEQTDTKLSLTPENTVVFTSTPSVIEAYRALGFAILPGEYDPVAKQITDPTPNEVVQQVGMGEVTLEEIPLSQATLSVFREFPQSVEHIVKLFHDPILTEQGDLTETRNYATYARAMADIIDLKYREIADFLQPGKIVDEGCADGALIERIVRDYPDSDIIGVDLSAEMLARANEIKREGLFGNAFVFFKQQNLMTPISEAQARTVDTIICNSTLHELWSYGHQASTVREYLRNKYKQLRAGGRLVIRDVVGPDHGDQHVYLWCRTDDGILADDPSQVDVAELSTHSRFLRFPQDFHSGALRHDFAMHKIDALELFSLPLHSAMEFIMKMDYTDNWASEMHEEFCFWSFDEWKRELRDVGFSVLSASHAYANQWRVDNCFTGHVQLYDQAMSPIPFPVTNMVLVGEKPGWGG